MDPIQEFCRDRLRVVSKSGTAFPIQHGVVMSSSITLFDTAIPVLTGDSIWHVLANGHEVQYVVANPGFARGHRELPASYNATVVPADVQRASTSSDHPAILSDSPGVRGVAVVERGRHTLAQLAMFRDLRRATGSLPKAHRPSATALVSAMEAAATQRDRIRTYQEFIGFVVDHLSIYQPTLVALTDWLSD